MFNTLLQDLLLMVVHQYGSKIALICGNNRFSYAELFSGIENFMKAFEEKGLLPADRVVIQTGNTVDTVMAFWATLILGGIAVIIAVDLPEDKVAYILQDSDPKLYLSPSREVISRAALNNHANDTKDLAAIIYTSGSTGEPKGVMLTHRNMLAATTAINQYLQHTDTDVVLSVLPLSFDYGLYQMIMMFSVGGAIVLEKNALVPVRILYKLMAEKCTILPCVPTLINLLSESAQHFHYDYSTLRAVTNTGATLTANHIHKVSILFPRAELFSMYGLTECKRCTYLPPTDLPQKPDSIGIPIPNINLYVVDENHQPVGPHVIGQLVAEGPTVMKGYWNDPVGTAEKIKNELLYTGDLVWMDDDHYLYFVGRMDEVIKYKGMKVSILQLEKELAKYDYIREVAVVEMSANDDNLLVACVSLHDPLVQLFKIQPPLSQLMIFNSLPKNINGKVDKNTLRRWLMTENEKSC